MTEPDARRRPGRALLAVLVVAVLAFALALTTDLALRRPPERPAEPAQVAPPPGLELPDPRPAPPVADPVGVAPLDPAAARRALAAALRDRDLGRHVLASVAGLDGGPRWSSGGEADTAVPASTTKLVTAAAALATLGPDHVFTTRVVARGRDRVVLVGGGDPYLERGPADAGEDEWPPRTSLVDLARTTARALRADGVRRVRLGYDDSLFSGPAVSPRWPADYIPGVVTPVHALWVDRGFAPGSGVRVDDPPAAAAADFAAALRERGVRTRGTPSPVVAGGGRELAAVEGAPLSSVVERVLQVSDNEAAEVLLRHVGLATGRPGSFDGGRAAVREALAGVGVRLDEPSVLWDGSGLSRESRLDPDLLVDVLAAASSPRNPDLRAVVTGLPVAGYVGSLSDRLGTGEPRAPGRVRAKTGTLSNVSSLAGIALDARGRPVLFALMADRIRLPRTTAAEVALDEAAAMLAGCACTR